LLRAGQPFAFAELLARVEALARRSATVVKETVLRVGDLELDLVSRTASLEQRMSDARAVFVIERMSQHASSTTMNHSRRDRLPNE